MTIEEVLGLVRPNIASLEAYSTARDDCGEKRPEIFLDANESPYDNGLNRYPDPHQKALKAKLSSIKGVTPESLFIGNGSDEAIDLLYRVFCVPGKSNAVSIAPSYGMYSVAAATNDIAFREVQLREDFSMDTEAMLSACDADTALMFICSPNNPTGNIFPKEQIEELLSRFRGIVVVDEAYIDFASSPSLVPMVEKYPNLVVLQTLSKAWGMAGLRLGLAIANPAVIAMMSKVKYPYNINVLAQKMALAKLSEDEMKAHVAEVVGQRFRLVKELPACPRVRKIYPSEANFLLVEFDDADAMYERLVNEKLIVRNRTRVQGCRNCLRITVGTPSENDRLLSLLGVGQTSPKNGVERLGGRHVRITRKTRETDIVLELDLDKSGESSISTGLGFFDHMLDQIPHHGGVSLRVKAEGDLEVDEHHTIEDVGIALGEALDAALGSKLGIARYGFVLPMDDCDACVLMDFGGRIDFKWKVQFSRENVGDVPTEMFSHFFQSVCAGAKCNLHISAEGENDHHKAESIFKAFARALRMAVSLTPFPYELPSSKGTL
ncbi:MAG: histidinol-phosphate transaminase [Candidatus Cryptobacteroides sp.]